MPATELAGKDERYVEPLVEARLEEFFQAPENEKIRDDFFRPEFSEEDIEALLESTIAQITEILRNQVERCYQRHPVNTEKREGAIDAIINIALEDNIEQIVLRIKSQIREYKAKQERDFFEQQANTEHLSGLQNAHAFNTKLAAAIERHWEKGTTFSLVYFDLDRLKLMNDTFGHQAGDEYIKWFGELLASTRSYDEVFRLGGDEFAILTPQCSAIEACRLALRISQDVKESKGFNLLAKESLGNGRRIFTPGVSTGITIFDRRHHDQFYTPESSSFFREGDVRITKEFEHEDVISLIADTLVQEADNQLYTVKGEREDKNGLQANRRGGIAFNGEMIASIQDAERVSDQFSKADSLSVQHDIQI